MFTRQHLPWRATSAAVIVAVALAFLVGQPPTLHGQSAQTKLTTVLADFASTVPQDAAAGATPSSARQPIATGSLTPSVRDAMRSRRLRVSAANEVQVSVLVDTVNDDRLAQLSSAGATIEIPDVRGRRVQAEVPASRLRLVAALPFVSFVRLPAYARHNTGAVTTEGDALLNADVARQQFGVDGTGVAVGVISDGIKGIFATSCTSCGGVAGGPIASGDLPSATGTRSPLGLLVSSAGGITGQSFASNTDLEGKPPASPPCGFAGAGAEGTALLEIVHDIAPGATLSFANADTDQAFNRAVNALAASNDIVVDDLAFFGEPYDGTSTVSANTAAALNNPSNRIRAYITSVGNGADEHYLGSYVDSGVDGLATSGITSPGHLHLFQRSATTTDVLGLGDQPYNLISLPNGGEVVMFLTWNDAFGASSNNYDLYLVRQSSGAVVARSTDTQSGSQDPVEAIDFTNTGATDQFRIVIQNVRNQAAPRQLNLFSFEPECATDGPRLLATGHHERHNFNTASSSVVAQGDAGGAPVSVISTGAICSGSQAASAVFAGTGTPDESCDDHTHGTIEFFSSQGPTIDGRIKPDIAAPDGVAVTGAGSFENPFFGTSATGPHVAGEAALLLQAAPCLEAGRSGALDVVTSRGTLRSLILGGATPLTDPAPDSIFGAGFANALVSIQHTLPVFRGSSSLVVAGNSPAGVVMTPAALGFTDPDQCAITELQWTGGCGTSPGGSLACPFGTTTVSVSATNNGLAFSPPSSLQVSVTNFGLAASPATATIAAGQTTTYQLTISSVGGPFQNAVSLSCANLPAGSSCAFSPATVVPGASSIQSMMTIVTSARASLAPAARQAPDLPVMLVLTFFVSAGFAFVIAHLVSEGNMGFERRASVACMWTMAAIASAGLVAAACGGGKAPPKPPASGTSSAAVSPASLTFASQTVGSMSAPQAVTVTNTGSAALAIASVAASGDFQATSACGTSVAAGASCLVTVVFTPTAAGMRTGSLAISDDASGSPQKVSLSGSGVSAVGGTPAGTYQVVVNGTSAGLVQSSTVTLVVQ